MATRRTCKLPEHLVHKCEETGPTKLFMGLNDRRLLPEGYSWHRLARALRTGTCHAFELRMLQVFYGEKPDGDG